jgi:putative hemolysin
MRRPTALAFLALIGLVACGTPYERCMAPVAAEIRRIDRLIVEVQTDIARGYTLVPEREWQRRVAFCVGPDNRSHMCFVDDAIVVNRPQAIDRAAERSKLAGLQERRAELEVEARRQQAACAAAHPQG